MDTADLIIKNANQLICPITNNSNFGRLKIIENGAIACRKGCIVAIDITTEILNQFNAGSGTEIINAETPSCAAVFDVPSTSMSEPFQRNITPIMNAGIVKVIGIIVGV